MGEMRQRRTKYFTHFGCSENTGVGVGLGRTSSDSLLEPPKDCQNHLGALQNLSGTIWSLIDIVRNCPRAGRTSSAPSGPSSKARYYIFNRREPPYQPPIGYLNSRNGNSMIMEFGDPCLVKKQRNKGVFRVISPERCDNPNWDTTYCVDI